MPKDGYCHDCQKKISPERVSALKKLGEEAVSCLECARKIEKRKKRIFTGIAIIPNKRVVEVLFPIID